MKRVRVNPALAALLAAAAILLFCLFALEPSDADAEGRRLRVEQAIRHAAVQCYALEGSYPPDVEYLKEHYGIRYDENLYAVHYWSNGSNLAPDIGVFFSLHES